MVVTERWIAVVGETSRYWWLHLVRGVAAIAFALIALASPGITLAFLIVLVAAWALVIGVVELTQAYRLRAIRHRLSS